VRRGHGAREYAERARVEWRASDLTRNEKDDTCVSMCERAVKIPKPSESIDEPHFSPNHSFDIPTRPMVYFSWSERAAPGRAVP
jgi:hypothetical protein